jgi:hypothetical protein
MKVVVKVVRDQQKHPVQVQAGDNDPMIHAV